MMRTAQSKTKIAPQPHGYQSKHVSVVHVPLHVTVASLSQATREAGVTPFAEPFLDWANHISKQINEKPGFVCLKINDDGYTNQELRCVYAAIARSLGSLNHRYGEFFDVKSKPNPNDINVPLILDLIEGCYLQETSKIKIVKNGKKVSLNTLGKFPTTDLFRGLQTNSFRKEFISSFPVTSKT